MSSSPKPTASRPELDRDDPLAARLYAHALRLISRREHSQAQLERKLCQACTNWGANPNAVATVLAAVAPWISDRRYAQMRIKQLLGRGYPPRVMIEKLHHEGISREISASIMASFGSVIGEHCPHVADPLQWYALLCRWYKGHPAGSIGYRRLRSRGFDHDLVCQVVFQPLPEEWPSKAQIEAALDRVTDI